MNLVKKNLFSIMCGLVALLAVGAIFWPIQGKYVELQKAADARKVDYDKAKTFLTKQRKLPQTDLDAAASEKNLEGFPVRSVIESWKSATEKVKEESGLVFKAAVEMNKHELLMADSLPIPKPGKQVDFKDKYVTELDSRLKDSLAVRTVNGGFVPSNDQVIKRKAEETEKFKNSIGDPNINPELKQQLQKITDGMEETMRQEVRDQILCYLDPKALSPYSPVANLQAGTPPEAGKVYVAQVGYWIQKDFLEAIRDANKDAKNVEDSAVKRLNFIKFANDAFRGMEPLQTGAQSPPVVPEPAPWPQPNTAVPFITQRSSNPIFDVVRFEAQLFADAEQAPRFLQELSKGRFITVLRCDVMSVDSATKKAIGYYYGDKPIVQLDLTCEELLLREWTKPLMPDSVKTALGIPKEQPQAKPTK